MNQKIFEILTSHTSNTRHIFIIRFIQFFPIIAMKFIKFPCIFGIAKSFDLYKDLLQLTFTSIIMHKNVIKKNSVIFCSVLHSLDVICMSKNIENFEQTKGFSSIIINLHGLFCLYEQFS